MKKHLIILSMLVFATSAYAQSPIGVGQAQFNAGVGFSSLGVPLYAGLDFGVHEDITAGGEISFRSYNKDWNNKNYHHSVFAIAGNCNYHFNRLLDLPREWDLYAGLNLGIYIWNSPEDYDGVHGTGVGMGAQVGGRYYFNERFGLNLELGGASTTSGGKFGISLRL